MVFFFLHKHPLHATPWKFPSTEKLVNMPQVCLAHGDQCQFGAGGRSLPMRGYPIKKPSGSLTNSTELHDALNKQCAGRSGHRSRPGGGKHILCSGRLAKEAGRSPRGLCKAVLRGIRNRLKSDGLPKDGFYGTQAPGDDAKIERNLRGADQWHLSLFKDDPPGRYSTTTSPGRRVQSSSLSSAPRACGSTCHRVRPGGRPEGFPSVSGGSTSTRTTTWCRTTGQAWWRASPWPAILGGRATLLRRHRWKFPGGC